MAEHDEKSGAEQKRSWVPNKVKHGTVKSKKDFDRQKVSDLVRGQKSVYKGELDPRKKREEQAKKRQRAVAPFASENRYDRTDEMSDFRNLFEPCEASPARLGALYVTHEVRMRNAYAQELIETTIDVSHMSAADRAFATLLTLGVVSTWGTLDDIINRAIQSPRDIKNDVRDALRISTYEIVMLGKAPHAAVDQGVELVKAIAPSASRLANAVLHRILAMKDDFPFGDPKKEIDALARSYAFPEWMARMLIEDLGAETACDLMLASSDPAPVFISVNSLKATDDEVLEVLEQAGAQPSALDDPSNKIDGCYRIGNPRALADGRVRVMFSKGMLLVSDASAQAIAASLFELGDPGKTLEVGAGRGTKTILIQSTANRVLGHQIDLTSLDSHSFKADLLSKRVKDYGVKLSGILTGNATRLYSVVDDRKFNTIFIDAPCSGLGTLRRHQEIRWRITQEHIDELAEIQLGMLKSCAPHVEEGGQLVYSTCTVTYCEDYGVVKKFLESDEGKDFVLAPINGASCVATKLTKDSPDAHFAVRFVRKKA